MNFNLTVQDRGWFEFNNAVGFPTYDFLLVCNSNSVYVLTYFWDANAWNISDFELDFNMLKVAEWQT